MSKLTLTTAALAAFVETVAQWPIRVTMRNTVWRPFAEALTRVELAGDGGTAEVSIPDAGTLYRVVQNVEQCNLLAGWEVEKGAGVFVEFELGESDDERKAREQDEAAQRAAAEAQARARAEAEAAEAEARGRAAAAAAAEQKPAAADNKAKK